MAWPDDLGHWGSFTRVSSSKKKGADLAQSVQGRLEVKEFLHRRECERKRECLPKRTALFFHKGEVMAWFACHPNHSIWRENWRVCVWGHLVRMIYVPLWLHTLIDMCTQEHTHHSISHLNTCAIMLSGGEGRLGAEQQFKNQHLTYSATESKLLWKSCTFHGQSNTNNSYALAQNYSWEGSFCVSPLQCVYFKSAQLTQADNWMLTSASAMLLAAFQKHTLVAFWHTVVTMQEWRDTSVNG